MRKVVTFLSVALCLGWILPAIPAHSQEIASEFKDVDPSHWAYHAVESLREKGLLLGYPDGYFRGKRTLTRYEFAVAIDRMLKYVEGKIEAVQTTPGPPGSQGPQGVQGPAGPQGPPGVTPQELQQLQALANAFKDELSRMGDNITEINQRLDSMAKELENLRAKVNKMPVIGGEMFTGIRTDHGNNFIDQDGRVVGSIGFLTNPLPVYDFHLTVDGNVGGGAHVLADMVTSNYRSYIGGSLSATAPFNSGNGISGTPSSSTGLYQLALSTPLDGVGGRSSLTIGRFEESMGEYVFARPTVDSYFHLPWYDNGKWVVDGLKVSTHIGSLGIELLGAKTNTVSDSLGTINRPWAGADNNSPYAQTGLQSPSGKPYGLDYTQLDSIPLTDVAGLQLSLPLHKHGLLQFQAMDARGDYLYGTSNPGYFNNVLTLGADLHYKLGNRLSLSGYWAKTNEQIGKTHTVNAGMNNAFEAQVGYGTGALSLSAGYKYIDPLFYSSGYWGRIGNWYNPTNIQGPVFKAKYDFAPNFGLHVGGNFYSPARNRPGFGSNDNINQVKAGVDWKLGQNLVTNIDWEGVYWSLNDGYPYNTNNGHPVEQYLTFGTGFHVSTNTMLRLMYQVIDFSNRGNFSPTGSGYNGEVLAGSVAVKF